jgi:glycosyltransferase involved in cell wall biosynthesis
MIPLPGEAFEANTAPAVSVVIPSYNQGKYLRGAIRSVLNQTFRNFEIVVVDDGSTDETAAVATSFGSGVRYLKQENRGLAGARNTGIRASKGVWIGLLDADDEWHPSFLDTMTQLAARHPEAAVLFAAAEAMDEDGLPLPQVFGIRPAVPGSLYEVLLRANFLIPSTILMRRSNVLDVGLFDEDLRSVEDWELWLRLLPKHHFVGTSTPLVRYRQHARSLSADSARMQYSVTQLMNKRFGPNEGQPRDWTPEKRRAYGGMYRYFALTCIQRCDDWDAAARHIALALEIDPTLAKDTDFFYELSLGGQASGYRGTSYDLRLSENASRLLATFQNGLSNAAGKECRPSYRLALGTAYHALSLLAYNSGDWAACRRYSLSAVRLRRGLLTNRTVVTNLAKSCLPYSVAAGLRRWRRRASLRPAEHNTTSPGRPVRHSSTWDSCRTSQDCRRPDTAKSV